MTSVSPGFSFWQHRTANKEAQLASWDIDDGAVSREGNRIGTEHKVTSDGPLVSHQSHLRHI